MGSLKTYLASLYIYRFQRIKYKYNVCFSLNLLIYALPDKYWRMCTFDSTYLFRFDKQFLWNCVKL